MGTKQVLLKVGRACFHFARDSEGDCRQKQMHSFSSSSRAGLTGWVCMRNAFVAFVGSDGSQEERAQVSKCPLNPTSPPGGGENLPCASSRPLELITLCPDGHSSDERVGKPGQG